MQKLVMTIVLGCALTIAGPGDVRALAQKAPAVRPHIEGTWVLNRDIGDQTSRGLGGGDPTGGPRPGGFGVGMGGGMVGGGGTHGGSGGGSDQEREEMERRRALMRELLEPSPRMSIAVDGEVVAFTEPDGRIRKFRADAKKEKHQFDNGTVETRSHWDPAGLVIEMSLQNGMKLIQTYGLTPATDNRQLLVQTTMEGGGSRDDDERKPLVRYYDDATDAQ